MSNYIKLLYGLMLDRIGLSVRSGWVDEQDHVYIYYTQGEIMDQLHCGHNKAIRLLKELDQDIGLIRRRRQGLGKPDRIYVMNFEPVLIGNQEDVQESHFQKCENRISRNVKTESQDMRISHANKTNDNQTENNHTDINQTKERSSNRKNWFHLSNERHYTKEDYEAMMRLAMT